MLFIIDQNEITQIWISLYGNIWERVLASCLNENMSFTKSRFSQPFEYIYKIIIINGEVRYEINNMQRTWSYICSFRL